MKKKTFVQTALAAAALLGASVPAAALTVFTLNIPAGATYGTVTLNQVDADTVSVTVDLSNSYNFVDTGAHEAFVFNVSGGAATVSGLTAGYTSTGASAQPGFGNFTNGIECPSPSPCQGGNNSSTPNDIISFNVDRAGITEGSFVANASGFIFSADLFGPNPNGGSMTFAVGNGGVVPGIPEPETYALMLAGLAAVGFMARRRRQA